MMSFDDRPSEDVGGTVQTTRIVVLALCSGVIIFAAVVLMQGRPDLQAPLGMFTIIAAAFTLMAIAMSFVLPRVIAANQCRQIAAGNWQPSGRAPQPAPSSDAGKLAAVYLTRTVVGAAVLEGAAFFALIAYLLERHVVSLALAGVLVLSMLAYLPTAGGVHRWVEDRLRLIEEQRQFSR